jgi:multidrug efflux system outer membrane protein
MIKSRLASALAVMSLSACGAVGPDFAAPTMDVPTAFTAGSGSALTAPELQMWWRELNDPSLDGFVAEGLANNLTIRSSLARVSQAEAQLRGTGVNAQTSGNLLASSTRTGGDLIPDTTTDTVNLSGSFVIDLFGGIQRAQEQAAASLQAAGFTLGDARATVTQSIVTTYITARFAQEAAALTRRTVASRQRTLELTRSNQRAGTSSEFEVIQAQSDLLTAQSDLQGYLSDFENSVFALATLTAADPAKVLAQMQPGAPQPIPRQAGARGTPADLLRNVPAVRIAEANYAAAVAGLGVQEAALRPSLTLSGTVTLSDPKSWSFGPALSIPVFNQPALRANRDAQVAAVEEAALNWQAAVRSAIEAVEVQSNSLLRSRRQIDLLGRAVAGSNQSLALTRINYEAGQSSLIELLDAERTTASRRLAFAAETRNAAIEWANLQVELGRGWQIPQ